MIGENCILRNFITCFPKYTYNDESRRMRWTGHVERMEEKSKAHGVFGDIIERKRTTIMKEA
jgi:hypothetical protein